MIYVPIPLELISTAADAPPPADTTVPQISPLPIGPLLVWELDEECYIAFGSAGYLYALKQRYAGDASFKVPCLVLSGETLEVARKKVAEIPGAMLAQALLLMDGGVYAKAAMIGASKTHVSRLTASWETAIPKLRDLWVGGMSNRIAFRYAAKSSAEQADSLLRLGLTDAQRLDYDYVPPGTRKGAPRGNRGRPSIKKLKKFLKTVADHIPRDDYEKGVADTLRFVIEGQVSTDSRWADYMTAQSFTPRVDPVPLAERDTPRRMGNPARLPPIDQRQGR